MSTDHHHDVVQGFRQETAQLRADVHEARTRANRAERDRDAALQALDETQTERDSLRSENARLLKALADACAGKDPGNG